MATVRYQLFAANPSNERTGEQPAMMLPPLFGGGFVLGNLLPIPPKTRFIVLTTDSTVIAGVGGGAFTYTPPGGVESQQIAYPINTNATFQISEEDANTGLAQIRVVL